MLYQLSVSSKIGAHGIIQHRKPDDDLAVIGHLAIRQPAAEHPTIGAPRSIATTEDS